MYIHPNMESIMDENDDNVEDTEIYPTSFIFYEVRWKQGDDAHRKYFTHSLRFPTRELADKHRNFLMRSRGIATKLAIGTASQLDKDIKL